jgi:HlyD family secretion protein
MKKRIIFAVIGVFFVGLFYLLSRPEPVVVSIVSVELGTVEQTVANTRAGTVKACQRSRLSLPIGGQIAQLFVKEGDHVEAGQLLMSLWNEDRAAQVAVSQASEKSAVQERQSICISAQSDSREYRRIVNLVKKNLVSKESADLAKSRSEASKASCEAAKAREIQARSAVTAAQAVLEQTHLRAPFAGSVAEVTGEIGEFSTPSPPGVATPPAIDLLTDDCHYISAPIDEVDASDIAIGDRVRVTLDAFRGKAFPSKIRRISPYIMDFEKQARTVEVEADLTTLPEGVKLLAGYSADMEIILNSRDNVLRIPSELVVDDSFVMVLDEEGNLQHKAIEKGLSNWRYTEVVSGLSEGESIVSNIGSAGVVAGARAEVGIVVDD